MHVPIFQSDHVYHTQMQLLMHLMTSVCVCLSRSCS